MATAHEKDFIEKCENDPEFLKKSIITRVVNSGASYTENWLRCFLADSKRRHPEFLSQSHMWKDLENSCLQTIQDTRKRMASSHLNECPGGTLPQTRSDEGESQWRSLPPQCTPSPPPPHPPSPEKEGEDAAMETSTGC